MSIVLVISDLHIPFHHKDSFDFLADIRRKYRPTETVCIGDEADFAGISFHEKNPDMPSPGDEYKEMMIYLKILYKLFPKVRVCTSNHTARPYRMAHKIGLPNLFIKSYREFLCAPKGWSWHDRILIQDVVYEHGEGLSGRNGAWTGMVQNKKSTVIGHLHGYGGVSYSESPFNQTFAMNVGCLIDPESLAFAYGAKYRNKATLGCGVVIDGKEAQFLRMK